MTAAPVNTTPLAADGPPPALPQRPISTGKVGVICMIASEIAFFGTIIAAYIFYIGRDIHPPYPQDVLDVSFAPLKVGFNSIFLLVSSVWIVLAIRAMRRGAMGTFMFWWATTIAFGLVFLVGTGFEWYGMIVDDGVWMGTNLFGTCFYTLVGFHALHVTVGLTLLTIVLILTLMGFVKPQLEPKIDLLSWYWHFVDGIWIVVFTVVYILGN